MQCADDLPIGAKRALEQIVRYVVSQPEAKDTLQGIRDWWLQVRDVDCNMSEVAQAVDTLVRWGWLTEQRLAEHTIVYGPSQEGLENGLEYLKAHKNWQT
jgi:hypothetical protein